MIRTPHPTCEHHETELVWQHLNQHGNPALVCVWCKPAKRSPFAGKFICWLSTAEAQAAKCLK